MCITPLTLSRPYKTMDGKHTDIVPCGKCIKCLKTKQHQWAFRLQQEQKDSLSSAFITLTYEDEPLSFNGHGTLVKSDLQKFWKRLRKHPSQLQKLKYYACGEYGKSSLRPHYHAIVFNLSRTLIENSLSLATEIWQNGHVHIAPANMARIYYTCKYITNGSWQPTQDDDDRQPQFSAMSKNLGKNYLTPQMVKYHKNALVPYVHQSGTNKIIAMPRYYKEKIFSFGEKRKIANELKNLHNMDWDQFVNHDFKQEIQLKKAYIRNESKRLKTEIVTL